ncbi:deoxyguanosinetriphosphate triphosphohydrolase [Myxococcota bacterium]|nr:deoxyguanosinetriphosphate triphosphohydrolase [Myxococcota bacterium]
MSDREITIREMAQEWENRHLHPLAARSSLSRGRVLSEEPCPVRTDYQRDRDRVIHSKPFRRLGRKTQVFLNPDGDHYRTRLTHSLEVTQIARTIANGLRLNENLVEAIGLSHDLGHTPFGHSGEAVLRSLAKKGFHHAHQSVRVVEQVASGGKGLNLTWEVRDGILKHSKGNGPILSTEKEVLPATLEGQIVRLADIIAYVNHDLEDAMRAGLIAPSKIPPKILRILGDDHSQRVGRLVTNVISATNLECGLISMGDEFLEAITSLREFLYENCYDSPLLRREFEKAERLLADLWHYFSDHRELIPLPGEGDEQLIDWLSGMTDRYAIRIWKDISLPRSWFADLLPKDE